KFNITICFYLINNNNGTVNANRLTPQDSNNHIFIETLNTLECNMKKLLSTAIATALTATGLLATSATLNTAAAEVAFNAGVMSQYIFRGMTQRDTAAFNGGVDYTHNSGIYLGLWAAQVGFGTQTSAGLEYDIYGGYKTSLGGFDLGAGFTSYNYTEKYKASNTTGFDSSYQELNFSAGYGPISLTVNPG
ncbi:MAG TPA: TorF family putative porin, partial [Thiotrichales bacterium]|nr:TorF family putative porin [Thiotrichales bacterium]